MGDHQGFEERFGKIIEVSGIGVAEYPAKATDGRKGSARILQGGDEFRERRRRVTHMLSESFDAVGDHPEIGRGRSRIEAHNFVQVPSDRGGQVSQIPFVFPGQSEGRQEQEQTVEYGGGFGHGYVGTAGGVA